MQGTGIGRALRTARLRRGKSLDDASRDTRVRAEYLEALEGEAFGDLQGDVYVRASLRSYARYLGLDPEKVLGVYERAFGPPDAGGSTGNGISPTPPKELEAVHRRPNWVLASVAAVILLLSAGAVGLLTRSKAPPPAETGSPPPDVPIEGRPVRVDIVALRDVEGTIAMDGADPQTLRLAEGEARSFESDERIDLRLRYGQSVRLRVNGRNLGTPGYRSQAYVATFTPEDFRERPSPTPDDVRETPSPTVD